MENNISKTYDPSQIEETLYTHWEESGYFHQEPQLDKEPYTIVIPPPNITGQLHMGHALDNTLQDILIRFKRMQGYNTLWVPGTDHASIATEAKIVAAMKAEGISKDDIGREGFLKRAWEWRDKFGTRITTQLKKLGSSCDWQRERFTLDEGCSRAVREVFIRLYEKGLIYKGERIINWCPNCLTSISDAEVEHEEKDASFWYIKYPIEGEEGFMTVATTRPETMLGDTALAVNPEDERYSKYIGKNAILPIVNKPIPIIADEYVESDFGTGVVKITPAHDPNDFEVGLRHDLPVINIMTPDGRINENGGKFEGQDRYECRRNIVKQLEDEGLLVKIEPMKHNVGTCYRCGTVVEPRVSKQWFVKMKPLAEPAIEAVRNGETKFVPERFDKIYYHWMENIKDWCISRQLWWGHRIPAWYCDDCGEMIVSREEPHTCPKCGSKKLTQDPDTLDTWFSSALWPFSTLGWPDETADLKQFYPTNTLVTGYDIIFFWVSRMIFSGIEHMGEVPFNTVFIHGIVRDEQGRKMSKSLGNGIDPLLVIEKYGADALRFTLATGTSPGNDMRFIDKRVEASRNFCNKIWNASRFILMNLDENEPAPHIPEELSLPDKWILTQFNTVVSEVTANLEKFELGIAVQKLYDFMWDKYCDWYIELAKIRLAEGGAQAEATRAVLVYVMSGALKLLHPFIPFITEEIWQKLPHEGDTIMLSDWPVYNEKLDFPSETEEMEKIMNVIYSIRNRRAEMNVPPSKKAKVYIATPFTSAMSDGIPYIKRLAFASEVEIAESFDMPSAVCIVTDFAKTYIPMGDLVDFAAERARLQKEAAAAQKELDMIEAKLSNPGFMAKAPEAVVEKQRSAKLALTEKLAKLKESLENLPL